MKRFQFIRCLAFLTATSSLVAQTGTGQSNPQTAHPPANIGMPHQIEITGCLKRGNEAGTFALTDVNGRTWALISGNSDVNLSKHIFHAVTITGKEVPTSQQHNGAGDQPQASQQSNNPRLELRVLTLEVLSRSCTR